MATDGVAGTPLADPPKDGISSVSFSPNSNLLLASSWDTSVTVYDVAANSVVGRYNHKTPVLDACFVTNTLTASGGLDKVVMTHDLETKYHTTLGAHDDSVKCLQYHSETGAVLSGSWDKTVKLWDHRKASALVHTADQPERVYSMDVVGNTLAVAHANRTVHVYDIRKLDDPQRRVSVLKSQTRCIRLFGDEAGFAISSIDGRVAIEYMALDAASHKKNFAFKCHRRKRDGVENVYPVNALAFHPVYGTFATGGCDGYVCTWDAVNRRRVSQLPALPTSIAALDFNHDGSLLAIASSYTYEQGEKDHPADSICIRSITDPDVKPKQKKKA